MDGKNVEVEETKAAPPALASTNANDEVKGPIETDVAKKIERNTKLQAHLNTGCGIGKKRSQLLSAFWGTMWKELEQIGWRKLEGVGEDEGAIYFCVPTAASCDKNKNNGASSVPKDLATIRQEGKLGENYYDRIRDVIDRILSSKDEAEKKIADMYNQAYSASEPKKKKPRKSPKSAENPQTLESRPARSTTTSRNASPVSSDDEPISSLIAKKRDRPSLQHGDRPTLHGANLDLSWKDGGSLYPKRSSQVGDEYQATDIPAAGTYTPGAHSELYELVWDPKASKNDMLDGLLTKSVPANKKEQALVALGLMGLNEKEDAIPNITEILSRLQPVDGSDWTNEEKEKFSKEIFRLRKDMTALSKRMGKDLKSCLTYYLGTFKKSDSYRLLKTVCADERFERSATNVHGVDACAVCGEGGSLLICDGCEGEYHMGCLRPALSAVPEGYWECDECVDKKLLKAREYIITQTRLYEPVIRKLQKADETSNNGNGTDDEHVEDGTILRPSPKVLAEIKKFAVQIDNIFSGDLSSTPNLKPSTE